MKAQCFKRNAHVAAVACHNFTRSDQRSNLARDLSASLRDRFKHSGTKVLRSGGVGGVGLKEGADGGLKSPITGDEKPLPSEGRAGEARPTDIARRLGVSHATAIKTIARLKREGLATARPYRGVFLTADGQALAARVRARHRLVVDVLVALGVPAEAAEADAEGIEHHVSETTLRAFGRFLQS